MIVTNGKIITWNNQDSILYGCALKISEGIIKEISSQDEILTKYPGEEILDADGQYVMPGNICAHTHFYGAFARGLGIPSESPDSFPEILKKLWWPLDRSLTLEGVYNSALVCMIDAIRHGTTTLFDHHASQNAIEGSLEQIALAVEKTGLRVSTCYEVTDRDGIEKTLRGIRENVRNIEYVKKQKPLNGRYHSLFGLHASLTLSEKTLDMCRDTLPDGSGFHIHVAEHPIDEYDSMRKCKMRVVERLEKHGILGFNTIAVHCVHVDAGEIVKLAESGTWVTHQPRSNMNNGVGIGDVESMLRMGINVCIGNDGFSNSMWEEWKTAYLVHKHNNLDPRKMPGDEIIKMGVCNNAKLATHMFGGASIGRILPGARADIIFVDYQPFTEMNTNNLPWHILFGFHESMVTMTMVDGKVLMYDRKLLELDEREIAESAMNCARGVWEKYNTLFESSEEK
jgi:putative selenium metabolism protein SsnA